MNRLRWALRCDDGAAVLEFVFLAVLVLVPLVYLVIAVMRVEAAGYAVTQAAREAGRAFIQADSASQGQADARTATALALADQGFSGGAGALWLSCQGRCLAPGSAVRITVATRVRLPFLPDFLDHVAAVPVSAEHVEVVDDFRSDG